MYTLTTHSEFLATNTCAQPIMVIWTSLVSHWLHMEDRHLLMLARPLGITGSATGMNGMATGVPLL